MTAVYKYELSPISTELQLPAGALALAVGDQDNRIFLWALIDTEQPLVTRHFGVYGTGHAMPERRLIHAYIGTVHMFKGALVFHVFEERHVTPRHTLEHLSEEVHAR